MQEKSLKICIYAKKVVPLHAILKLKYGKKS